MKRILKVCGLVFLTNIILASLVLLVGLQPIVLGTLSYLVLREFKLI